MTQTMEEAARFVRWLEGEAIADARGDRISEIPTRPADSLWLGRLAPEEAAWKVGKGVRAQRLDPCSMGMTFRPQSWEWRIEVSFVVWSREGEKKNVRWKKSDRIDVAVEPGQLSPTTPGTFSFGEKDFASEFSAKGIADRSARIDVEIGREHDHPIATVLVVNDSEERKAFDANMYEVVIRVRTGPVTPILLDALPDSFRYDRRISAYGVNAGVTYDGEWLESTDAVTAERRRPEYWDDSLGAEPDLAFATLARDPVPVLRALVDALERWGETHWSEARLADRAAEGEWTDEMQDEANRESKRFAEEVAGARAGLEALDDEATLHAFQLMNEAFEHSGARGRYTSWRPFQMGFLLTALPSLARDDERRRVVDTLWFATGGGKTETYLAAIVFSCFIDRLRGKHHGITAWSRFPLRMLSLQQTQRFADALAGAELARQRAGIDGDPFALGFLVGGPPAGTPNRIRDDASGNETDTRTLVPESHQVLLHCPFCFSDGLKMHWDRRSWRLEHRCTSTDCPWTLAEGLPFHIVDDEIYRFLPSVVVGTLDKAASVAIQAAQRGLYASPIGRCSRDGHGFTYAPRSKSPNGCQVPGCKESATALGQDIPLFAPTLRVQDELHLLRDSLGAVDSHYETLLDHLQRRTKSPSAKVIASSATLSGYEHQVDVLYDREGNVFPLPGPAPGASFWTKDSAALARRYVGLAPRGQTLEFANDRLSESLQRAVRRLINEPQVVCAEAGIDPSRADALLDWYGTHVVYGTKLADVDAAARSFETGQVSVTPLNVERLTGDTELEKVREVLARLGDPEPAFNDRIHVICASSMMSHGVDVDRFNVITLLGIPLATAEFIQTSARIGRRHPGLVFVLHRMGVERDSSVFRSFAPYVEQGDRFIEPIAITRRSRRVLEHTFPGMFSARVHGIHEAKRVRGEGKSISIARDLRAYAASAPVLEDQEFDELCDALGLDPNGTSPLAEELRHQLRLTFQEVNNPASRAFFISELLPAQPMRSLREVETQIEIHSKAD